MPTETPTVAEYQQNGGTTVATAEGVAIGSTLLGRVAPKAPRYYFIDMKAGDTVKVTVYARALDRYSDVEVEFREPDDVVLGSPSVFASKRDSWDRAVRSVTAKQDGRHMIYLKAEYAAADYKVLFSGTVVTP